MTFYLSSPDNRLQWEAVRGMPVLLSYALAGKKEIGSLNRYQAVASRVLIDSGAFSELNTGRAIDLAAYADWSEWWRGRADAVAALDDISGDWRRGLRNVERMPPGLGFPTWHDTDPPELLADLLPVAAARGGWIGLGLKPPRHGKEKVVRWACDQIPPGLHVHGWAMGAYTHVRRLDSADSTNWLLDLQKYQINPLTEHLTDGEMLEIIVKRYQRWTRRVSDPQAYAGSLLAGLEESRD